MDDVRPTLQYYSQFDDPAKEFRKRAVYLAEQVRIFPIIVMETSMSTYSTAFRLISYDSPFQEAQKDLVKPNNESYVSKFSGKLFGFRRHQST